MTLVLIIGLWILNFFISWANAWGVGKTWNESKHRGGFPHFMNWMGAIMSASGFTWCYLLIVGGLASVIPLEQDDGTYAPLLGAEALEAFCNLGYLVIIFPIIGSGIAIMIHSWGVFYRRRTFGTGAVAGWNTFANIYNIGSALSHVPKAGKGVFSFFSGDDKNAQTLVVMLVALAAIGGILTTYLIVTRTAKSTAKDRAFDYKMMFEKSKAVYAKR